MAQARPSVVKVHGEANSCVGAGGSTDDAAVISYDPQADIAILDVPGLSAPPLRFAGYMAGTGTQALVLGYPGATAFKASPAQIRETTELNGPDIYHATSVTRQVYILDGSFPESGASGSAVVDLYGQVLGVYSGAQTDDSTTGFAISAAQAVSQLAKARGVQPASTGACVS